MDSDHLGTYVMLIVVLECALALLAGAVSIVAARYVWRRWPSRFDSTGRRLALMAAGLALFLLLLLLIWLLAVLIGVLVAWA
jgi:hypothetical protein